MTTGRTKKKGKNDILEVLDHIRGVKHSFYLTREQRTGLGKIEKKYPSIGPLTIRNDGVLECLRREHVACIVKDKSFRAPPHSTVMLVNDNDEVLGRELIPGEKIKAGPGEKLVFLGDDFVLFANRYSGKGARFVLPPVPFNEVERLRGVGNVVSSSPSTMGDLFLRKSAHLKDDPKLASILVGFDLG